LSESEREREREREREKEREGSCRVQECDGGLDFATVTYAALAKATL